jgi:hypothetical protein
MKGLHVSARESRTRIDRNDELPAWFDAVAALPGRVRRFLSCGCCSPAHRFSEAKGLEWSGH